MMDYWVRLILATIIGIGIGLGIAHFLGNHIIWVGFCLAASIATESALRTFINVKVPDNPIIEKADKNSVNKKKIPNEKPPKHNF